jgi:hypothetical protein
MITRLVVNLGELAAAFDEPRRGPVRTFFDRVTGTIEPMPRDAEVEGVYDDIVAAPERWIEIRPVPLAQRLELRRRFLEQVADPHHRLQMADALAGQRPLARFDALLRGAPTLLDAWLSFRTAELAMMTRAWLSALGVEPR